MLREESSPEGQYQSTEVGRTVRIGRPRLGAAALVAVGLTIGAIGGGALGTIAASEWLLDEPQSPAASASDSTGQTINITSQPNIANAVYEKVGRSVVEITVSGQSLGGLTPSGSGSGFVVDANGLIMTNYHVVANARTISVRFYDGSVREATVLGTDRGNDLALLKVDLPSGIPVVPLGDSDEVQVGETAIAIGNPFGLEGTVTQGIISAVQRDWQPANGRLRNNLIQTDAPINPGNSGGPLLNANGEVIGINSLIESPVNGSVGIGFAIPINTAKQLLPDLQAGAQLEPAWLGITGMALDQTIARDQGLSVTEGVLITSVLANSPASQSGLRGGQGATERVPIGGDVITAINGKRAKDMTELAAEMATRKPGETVKLTIVRGSQTLEVNVTLQTWPNSGE
jgi:S1-C subfamily serine protease